MFKILYIFSTSLIFWKIRLIRHTKKCNAAKLGHIPMIYVVYYLIVP